MDDLIRSLDPIVTEPILTGRLLFGDAGKHESFAATIRDTRPTPMIAGRLFARALDLYLAARVPATRAGSTREFWTDLSYSLTYWGYARAYVTGEKRVLTLQDVIARYSPRARALWTLIMAGKRGPRDAEPGREAALNEWEVILLAP